VTTQGKFRNCFDCGAPITEGGVTQHDFGCDAAPNCQCAKTLYCESCKRLNKAIANTALAEAVGNTFATPMNRAARRRALREIERTRREADDNDLEFAQGERNE
jgi:hypothetical protein